jgi:TRAP transporter TAXI family solute receptor
MRSPRRRRWTTWPRAIAALGGVAALTVVGLACAPLAARPGVVIGTASPTGIYYPLGGAICRLLNLETSRHGLRCSEEPSSGAVANVESLRRGRLDIGIVPSDVLADAVAGQGSFTSRGPTSGLRTLFAGPDDMLTIVARTDLGIRTVAEVRGTRINIGNPGSRQRANLDRVLAVLGLGRSDFVEVRELAAAEQHDAFCSKELDVIVYSVGHPNGLIHDVTRTCHGRLVDVSGPAIDRMLSEYREYERAVIPGGTYADDPADVQTFGVRAVVVTSPRVSDTMAYEITRAVFENFDAFRRLHPAFETLSVADMVRGRGRAPVHAGATRYYRERGWLP